MQYEKIRLHAAICLRSIALIQASEKPSYSKNKIKYINTAKQNLNSGVIYDQLFTPWHILNLNAQEKSQVVSILKCYSSKNSSRQYNSSKATCRYLQRFQYRHGKCCVGTFQLKNNNQREKLKQDRVDGISAAYAIYKALQVNNKFSAYRKIKNNLS